ncbi:MAG: hypothetical protein U0637_07440 [Phycisphaerales bacterium]
MHSTTSKMQTAKAAPRRTPLGRRAAVAAVLGGAVGGVAQPGLGQNIPWIGATGNWNTAANWQGGNIPDTATEIAVLDGASPFTVSHNVSTTVGEVQLLPAFAALYINANTTLTLASGNLMNNGVILVNPTAWPFNSTTIELAASGTISGTGTVVLNASTSWATAQLRHSSPSHVTTIAASQTIRGTGQLVGGTIINDGAIRADVNGRSLNLLAVLSGQGQFVAENGGILALSGVRASGVTFAGLNAGRVQFRTQCSTTSTTLSGASELDAGTVLNVSDGTLTNNGTITVNPTAGGVNSTLWFSVDGSLVGTGAVTLNANPTWTSARLYHTGSHVTTIGENQTIRGVGQLENGTWVLDGTVSPGTTSDPTGVIRGQACTIRCNPTARLEVDIGGTAPAEYDAISGTGTLMLGGTLTVSLINGFSPACTCDEFTVLTGTSVIGAFDQVNFPPGSAGHVRYEPTRVAAFFGPTCDPIDFNGDGLFPDTADIDDFLSVFSGGPCSTGTCGDIDFNNDGLFPDTSDIDSLLSVFSGGACV